MPFRAALRLKGAMPILGLRRGEPLLPRVIFAGADAGEAVEAFRAVRRPEDWPRVWSELARGHEEQARDQLERHDVSTAEELLRRAVACWRVAEYLAVGPEERRSLWERLQAADELLCATMSPVTTAFDIEVQGVTLPCRVRRPAGDGDVPAVITLGGVDGVKEEFHDITRDYLARGWASISLDLPGQGEPRRFRGITWRPDVEVVIATLLDALLTGGGIDPRALALVGGSAGGYFALRAAAFEPRITACATISAPFNLEEVFAGAPAPIPDTMAYNLGVPRSEARATLRPYTLETILDRISCPVWLVHGGADRTVPPTHFERILAGLQIKPARMTFPDGDHMCFNHRPRWEASLRTWLVQTFREARGGPDQPEGSQRLDGPDRLDRRRV